MYAQQNTRPSQTQERKVPSLTPVANATRKLFDQVENGTNEQRQRLLSQAKGSSLLLDALTLIVSADIAETGRTLGSKRLLEVVRIYPETRASIRALDALSHAVKFENPSQALFTYAQLWKGAGGHSRANDIAVNFSHHPWFQLAHGC